MSKHHQSCHFLSLSLLSCIFSLLSWWNWSVSGIPAGLLPLYLHTPLHLPGESHLRCLATWRALCYCREEHSRAKLTPTQAYSFVYSPLALYPTEHLIRSALWSIKIKIIINFGQYQVIIGGTSDIIPVKHKLIQHFGSSLICNC